MSVGGSSICVYRGSSKLPGIHAGGRSSCLWLPPCPFEKTLPPSYAIFRRSSKRLSVQRASGLDSPKPHSACMPVRVVLAAVIFAVARKSAIVRGDILGLNDERGRCSSLDAWCRRTCVIGKYAAPAERESECATRL